MWGILAKNKQKYKIIVPWWRYLSCLTNDLKSLKNNAKIPYNIANHGYTMTHVRPVHIQRCGFSPNQW